MVTYQATVEKLEDALERAIRTDGPGTVKVLKIETVITQIELLGWIADQVSEINKRLGASSQTKKPIKTS